MGMIAGSIIGSLFSQYCFTIFSLSGRVRSFKNAGSHRLGLGELEITLLLHLKPIRFDDSILFNMILLDSNVDGLPNCHLLDTLVQIGLYCCSKYS